MFLKKIEKLIFRIENSKVPFAYFLSTFFFLIIFRYFLEMFSTDFLFSPSDFYHIFLFFLSCLLTFVLLFHFSTKENIEKIVRFLFLSFGVILLTPLLDIILTKGKGYKMTYILPGVHKNLLLRFLTFGGSFHKDGLSPGIKIEVGLILLGCFVYFLIKNKNIFKSLFFTFFAYLIIFLFGIAPFLAKAFLQLFNLQYRFSASLMINFYLLLLFILSIWIFYLYNKKFCIEIFKDIRPFRLLHYELMFMLGFVIREVSFMGDKAQFSQELLFSWIFIIIAIMYAGLFSGITNNLADYEIDKISNPNRPTVANTIPIKEYKMLSGVFLMLAIIYSLAASYMSLFLILLLIGSYFLYSVPPLRLKRITFFSKILISLNAITVMMLGYSLNSINYSIFLPSKIIFFSLIFLTASINFIDIKDYKGDKKAGIKTLPVILGLEKSKKVIGLFFLISYLAFYFLLKDNFLLPFLILFGIIEFLLINRKKYNEKPVFLVYLLSVISLIIYLLFFNF